MVDDDDNDDDDSDADDDNDADDDLPFLDHQPSLTEAGAAPRSFALTDFHFPFIRLNFIQFHKILKK